MPNSSTSIRSGVIAAALMTTNGPSVRLDALCSVRAASSLPEPEGPTIRMRLLALAARSMVWRKLVHAGGASGENAGGGSQLLEFLHFALEARGLQRPRRHQDQPVRLERLFDEVIGAALDRRDRGLDVAVAGDHHHGNVGVILLDLLEQLQAVELGALQPDVEEHQIRAAVGNLASAESLSRAVRVLKPSSSRMPATRSRISASSSTIRMSLAMGYTCLVSCRMRL